MWYNLTAVNASNVLVLTQSVDNLFMYHQLGNLILMVLFFISFLSMLYFNNNPKINIVASSFLVAIMSIAFNILGLAHSSTVFVCWGIFAVSLAVLVFTK